MRSLFREVSKPTCVACDDDDDDDDDDDVGLRVLGCRVDMLGTNCNVACVLC